MYFSLIIICKLPKIAHKLISRGIRIKRATRTLYEHRVTIRRKYSQTVELYFQFLEFIYV